MEKNCYNKRTWLNDETSPSTGNVVCHDGWSTDYDGKKWRNLFVSVSDCYQSARLHKTAEDSTKDFMLKIVRLRDELTDFVKYLATHLCDDEPENV